MDGTPGLLGRGFAITSAQVFPAVPFEGLRFSVLLPRVGVQGWLELKPIHTAGRGVSVILQGGLRREVAKTFKASE